MIKDLELIWECLFVMPRQDRSKSLSKYSDAELNEEIKRRREDEYERTIMKELVVNFFKSPRLSRDTYILQDWLNIARAQELSPSEREFFDKYAPAIKKVIEAGMHAYKSKYSKG